MDKYKIKNLLTESVKYLNSNYGFDPRKDFSSIAADDAAFESYKNSIYEGVEGKDRELLEQITPTMRKVFLESNFTAQMSPYQQLILPLIRVFFPRLVAKEAVTVTPINAPYVVKYFLKPVINAFNGTKLADVPAVNVDTSAGLKVPTATKIPVASNVGTGNLIQAAGADPSKTTLDRATLYVYSVTLTDGTNDDTVVVNQKVDGVNGQTVVNVSSATVKKDDTLLVAANWETGDIKITSTKGNVKDVSFNGRISLESNQYLPQVELKLDKIALEATSRKLGVKWSIETEQDFRMLLDLDFQAEAVSIMGQQIAVDIDREIINDLLTGAQLLNPNVQDSFSKTMPSGYAFGQRWAA